MLCEKPTRFSTDRKSGNTSVVTDDVCFRSFRFMRVGTADVCKNDIFLMKSRYQYQNVRR